MSDSEDDDRAPMSGEKKEGPDQTEKINKSLLMAFKAHLESGDIRVPQNNSLDDPEDDDAWAQEENEITEEERREVMGMFRAFVQQKIEEEEAMINTEGSAPSK